MLAPAVPVRCPKLQVKRPQISTALCLMLLLLVPGMRGGAMGNMNREDKQKKKKAQLRIGQNNAAFLMSHFEKCAFVNAFCS